MPGFGILSCRGDAPAVGPGTCGAGCRVSPGLTAVEQGEGDLGLRMARCLDRFAPRPRLLFGADIPAIDAGVAERSFDLLKQSDLLFGPAEDGGFWLVGQRGPERCSGLFDGVPWSSPETLAATLRNVPRHRRVAFAETLADVDDGAAYRAWKGGRRIQL